MAIKDKRSEKIYDLICDGCGYDFKGTVQQKTRDDHGLPVYCSGRCAQAKSETGHKKERTPWKWLGVKHVLDELPKEDPNEIYVGF